MDCPFCDKKETDYRIIYKDSLIMALPGIMPIVPGHTLVMPLRHISKIDELSDQEFKAIKEFIIKLKASLVKSFDAQGFNIAWNENKIAGQSINHLHFHVVPRKEGDKGIYQYEPREFLYWPGFRKESPKEELKSVAELIKKNLEL